MKKKSLSFLVLSLLFCGVAMSAQINSTPSEVEKALSPLTLPEAKKELNNGISQLSEAIQQIEQLQSLRVIVDSRKKGHAQDETSSDYDEKQQVDDLEHLKQRLTKKMENHSFVFEQDIIDGQSRITPVLEDVYNELVKYNADEYLERVSGKMSSVQFYNGDSLLIPQETQESDSSRTVLLKTTKPIKSMDFALQTSAYDKVNVVTLSPTQREVKQGNALYRLTSMDDNSISLFVSSPKNSKFVINGLAANGQALREVAASESTLSADQDLDTLKQNLTVLKDAKKHFSEFKNTQDLIHYVDQHKVEKNASGMKTSIISKQFSGQIKSVEIYALNDLQPLVLNIHLRNQSPHHYAVAKDSKHEKYGLVDNSGRWLLTPQFDGLKVKPQNNLFKIITNHKEKDSRWFNTTSNYARFDQQNHKMVSLPFYVVDELKPDLLMVRDNKTDLYGLYQWQTQQFLLPMQFYDMSKESNVLHVAKTDQATYYYHGLYSLEGKEIVPLKYDNIEIEDSFAYARLDEQRTVFDLDGKRINPKGTTAIGDFKFNQPLLIQNNKDGRYQFINQQGQVLKYDLPYDEVSPFSNGMAIVKKAGKYGAINLQGKLAIPLTYDELFCFQKNYAGAVLDSDGVLRLIDRSNNTVMKLGHYQGASSKLNSNENTYTIYRDGEQFYYDADGHQIKD